MIQNASAQLFTADGQVGSSGTPAVRVFMMHIISTSTAAVVSLRNGTSSGATAYVTQTGTISTGSTFTYGLQGMLFPSGCFCDMDANTTSVLVTFCYV
jgi:hypothetical protein